MLPTKKSELIFALVMRLTTAINNIRLYSFDHPQVTRELETVYNRLAKILKTTPEITILLIGDELVADNCSIQEKGTNISQFIRFLRENAIERITFLPGVPKRDLYDLIKDIASPDTVSVFSSTFIKLGKINIAEKEDGSSESTGEASSLLIDSEKKASEEDKEKLEILRSLRDLKLEQLKTLYHNMKRYKKIDVRSVDDVIKSFLRVFNHNLNPIGLLASLKNLDEYTFTHVVNVCILTMSQAEALGFSRQHLYQIGISSILHDVGKLFIPDEILNKPGALTPEERSIIETHTVKGARYIINLDNIPKLAVISALEHHIRYDGTGYPSISNNWKPNIISQLIAISDSFDAMRSRRPYQDPKPEDIILDILKDERGTTFNPFLVDNFINVIKR